MNNNERYDQIKLDTQLKLKIFQCIKGDNITSSNIFINRCLIKIVHLLFLKNIITSKSNNRIIHQYFKRFLFNFKTTQNIYNELNPAFSDSYYNQTLIVNSIYELLNNAHEF